MSVDLNRLQRDILEIIQNNPQAANDEAMLLDIYYHHYGKYRWDDSKSFYWNMSRVKRPETITRRRRELYNLGLITYSDEKLKDRETAYLNEKEQAAQVATPKYEAVSWLYD